MEYIKSFKAENDWVKRLSKTQYLKTKYPDRIPVIVDRSTPSTPKLTSNRFLIPFHITMSEFCAVLRRHMPELAPHQALFFFVGAGALCEPSSSSGRNDKGSQILCPMSQPMSLIYTTHKDKDNFLYITTGVESTFG